MVAFIRNGYVVTRGKFIDAKFERPLCPSLRALTTKLKDLHSCLVLGGGTFCLGALQNGDPIQLHAVDQNPGWDADWFWGPYGHEDVPDDETPYDAIAGARRLLADVPLRLRSRHV
jgi:hypothetical protein